MINLQILPFKTKNDNVYSPNFSGRKPSLPTKKVQLPVPTPRYKVPKSRDPYNIAVSSDFARFAISDANEKQMNLDDWFRKLAGFAKYLPKVTPLKSKAVNVGNCKVTSLIDGGQIFDAYEKTGKGAKEFLLVKMFQFQNTKVDGHRWFTNGSENVPGAKQQQHLLDLVTAKTKEFKPQVTLDIHKWYIDSTGKKRHHNNMEMIRYLKEHGTDVIPSPQANQGGSKLDHIKIMIGDDGKGGKRAVVSGMNWGTHSPANHDFGFLLESLPGEKNSEVDNLIQLFNDDRKFALERLENTPLIKGPLTEAEQVHYNGLNKEIKEESVEYMKIVGELFKSPEEKNRYSAGKYTLTPCTPVASPKIDFLRTSPREMQTVGVKGQETIREKFLKDLRTAKHYVGVNFVFTEKESVDTIIKRHKSGELDATLIVESGILKDFPYCRKAYNKLKREGVKIVIFKTDKDTNQKLHAKLNIFDKLRILSGSVNISETGMNSNLEKGGLRKDCPLHTQNIEAEIKEYADAVKEHEKKVGLPPIGKQSLDHDALLERKHLVSNLFTAVRKGKTVEAQINGKTQKFTPEQDSSLATIKGYYGLMQERHKAKVHNQRGNNEIAMYFENADMAKHLLKQIDRDFAYSTPKEPFKEMEFPMPTLVDGKWTFVAPKKTPKKGDKE